MQVKFQGITFLSGPREKVGRRHSELAQQLRDEQGQKSCLYYLDTTFGDKFTHDTAALLDEKEELKLLEFIGQELGDRLIVDISDQPSGEEIHSLLWQVKDYFYQEFNDLIMEYVERHKDVDAYGQPTQREELT